MTRQAVAFCHDVAILWRFVRLRRALLCYAVVIACLLVVSLLIFPLWRLGFYLLIGIILFLPVEYLAHRFALHSMIYLDSRWLARIWIRMHYAHHRVPDREDVILASPLSGPILIAITNPPFMLLFGPLTIIPGAAIVLILFGFAYEPVHYASHKNADFRSRYFLDRRRLHLMHHFHNEQRNYGICASLMDRIVGTHAERANDAKRSPSVMTLGYDGALAQSKPIVGIEYERSLRGH